MARKPRIQFEGAFYHVIVRGNQKQDIFLEDDDCKQYMERLQKYRKKCNFVLYAYVLMSNHVHLLIETPADPISRIMQLINFTYTQYFNKKYWKTGHLFQGRYKSYLCDKDKYLLCLIRYIHNNPVRAGMVSSPIEYEWSSHRDYLEKRKSLIEADRVLRLFSERPGIALKKYEQFMNGEHQGGTFQPYSVYQQQIVGDESFIEEIERRTNHLEKRIKRIALKELIIAVEQETGIGFETMTFRSRDVNHRAARATLVALAREAGYRITELQGVLKRDLSVLSRLAAIGEELSGEKTFKRIRRRLIAKLQA
jgi:putative transposase